MRTEGSKRAINVFIFKNKNRARFLITAVINYPSLVKKRITEEREKEKREWRDECSKRSHPNTRILINIPTRQRSWLIWVNITTKISHPNVSLLVSSSSFYACLPPTKPARPNVVTLWIFEFIQRSPFCLPLYAYQARRFQLPSSFVSRIKCLLLSELGCCRALWLPRWNKCLWSCHCWVWCPSFWELLLKTRR